MLRLIVSCKVDEYSNGAYTLSQDGRTFAAHFVSGWFAPGRLPARGVCPLPSSATEVGEQQTPTLRPGIARRRRSTLSECQLSTTDILSCRHCSQWRPLTLHRRHVGLGGPAGWGAKPLPQPPSPPLTEPGVWGAKPPPTNACPFHNENGTFEDDSSLESSLL